MRIGGLLEFFTANGGKFAEDECDHEWVYDAEESTGPWTGYIERCAKCGEIQQIPL